MSHHDPIKDAARADLCRFLAACFYEPGPEFAEEKLFNSMHAAASRIDPDLAANAQRLGKLFSSEGGETLLIDYARLFLGPNDLLAVPYESVWVTGEKSLMQDSTMAVLDLYAAAGFEMDEAFREVPDHIAVELEFLYLLIYRENEARRNGDDEAATTAVQLRKRLLDEHLGRWIGTFTAAMRSGAQTAFYRELAEITAGFVRMEIRMQA